MPRFLKFGHFEVDLEAEELRRKGIAVRLSNQSFQVLRLFLHRPGELISRPELQRALWPSDSYGDFEHGLNAAVNRLREALGDSATTPHFIETLPRRGYRFIADVESVSPVLEREREATITPETVRDEPSASVNSTVELQAALQQTRSRRKHFGAFAGAAAFAVLLTVGSYCWYVGWRSENAHLYADVRVVPLTTLPGTESAPSFSPDGSHIAFAWDGGKQNLPERYDLYVKVVGSERLEQLTHHPAGMIVPAWSPDGRTIAFARWSEGHLEILTIAALGGPERKLAEGSLKYALGMSLSWSPDGTRLAYGVDVGLDTAMQEVSVVDGKVRPIASNSSCSSALIPTYSPDGKELAFACLLQGMRTEMYTESTQGGFARKLYQGDDLLQLAWSADSTRIFFAQSGKLFTINRDGGPPVALDFAHAVGYPAVSRSGARLAYAERTRNVNLWEMKVSSDQRGATSLLAPTSSNQRAPDISPDGTKLAFESERTGRHDVWVSNRDGSEAIELGEFKTITGSPRWSPYGGTLAFDSMESGRYSLYLADTVSGVPHRLDTGDLEAQMPRWSKDGKWIYFTAPNHSQQIFKVSPSGGPPQRVSDGEGWSPQEDHSGTKLYFSAGVADATIHVLNLASGREESLHGMPQVSVPTEWALAAKGIYFIDQSSLPATIDFYSFDKQAVTARMPLPKPPELWGGLSLSKDESWLAYAQIDRDDSDLMLAEPVR